jgi:hypothetical protein
LLPRISRFPERRWLGLGRSSRTPTSPRRLLSRILVERGTSAASRLSASSSTKSCRPTIPTGSATRRQALAAQAVDAVRKATTTIPIVMAGHGDALGAGVIGSLARPGGQYHWTCCRGDGAGHQAARLDQEDVSTAGADRGAVERKRFRPPVEQPIKIELVINLRTAKALGLAAMRSTVSAQTVC